MDLTPITTPLDWTAERDFASFEERWDQVDDYFHAALEKVAEGYEELNDAVDAALCYFERKDHRLTPIHPGTLNLGDKLQRLSVITNTWNNNYQYKTRFAEHIHGCQWADTERQRIMTAYYLGTERVWLQPLCDLADALGYVASELEQCMEIHHDDYK